MTSIRTATAPAGVLPDRHPVDEVLALGAELVDGARFVLDALARDHALGSAHWVL